MAVFAKLHKGPDLQDEALWISRVTAPRQGQSLTQRTSDHDRVEDYPTNDADPIIYYKLQKTGLPSNAQRELLPWLLIK